MWSIVKKKKTKDLSNIYMSTYFVTFNKMINSQTKKYKNTCNNGAVLTGKHILGK